MKRLYCISGLGADFRVFQKLDIQADLIPIEYTPISGSPSLESYVLDLLEQIDDSKPVNLLGISFGGVVLQELSKLIQVDNAIIVSSFFDQNELRFIYRLLSKTGVLSLVPKSMFRHYNRLIAYLFGIDRIEDQSLLRGTLNDSDIVFSKWAVQELLNWKGGNSLKKYISIHGSKDHIIPLSAKNRNIEIIEEAGHLLTLTHPENVSRIINDLLNGVKE